MGGNLKHYNFDLKRKVEETAKYLQNSGIDVPQILLILGSGHGDIADKVEKIVELDYSSIPNFPISTVAGHRGRLVFGKLCNKKLVIMQGRFHYYEGYSLAEITFPIRVMKYLGANDIILTNAAGALNRHFQVGDLMVITDHINLIGDNPLIGPNDDTLGPRFPSMYNIYTPELIQLSMKIAREHGIPIQKGIYVAVSGPNYETSAELRALRLLGADAVGMSTVPEVIVAVHSGYKRILAISCITDMATGEGNEEVSHEQVLEVANNSRIYFSRLLENVIIKM